MSSKKEEKLRRKHEKSLTRASTASGGDGTTSSTQTKATRETRKLSDLKNPSNMTVDERREDELGLRKRARDEETAHPSQLVAARADQNRASLGARVNRVGGGEEPEAGEPSDLFQKLFRVNTEMYKKRNDQAFPLERLVGPQSTQDPRRADIRAADQGRQERHLSRGSGRRARPFRHAAPHSLP